MVRINVPEGGSETEDGNTDRDIFIVRGGTTIESDPSGYPKDVRYYDTVDTIVQAWRQANPDSNWSFNRIWNWIVTENHLQYANGELCQPPHDPFRAPVIHPGQRLKVPEGNEIPEFDPVYECPPERRVVAPVPIPLPPVAREVGPREYLHRAAPADTGRLVNPETNHGAYEFYARSGVNPRFTQAWYSLEDIAARIPVMFARDSGQVRGDHLIQGQRFRLTENLESMTDDRGARIDMQGGGRQRGFITGYISSTRVDEDHIRMIDMTNASNPDEYVIRTVTMAEYFAAQHEGTQPTEAELTQMRHDWPVGGMTRHDRAMFETAHGGDYPLQASNRTGLVADFPIGVLTIPASEQMPFDAEMYRYGMTQTHAVLSWEDFIGRDTVFRDTQARTSSPFETPDRINARTFVANADREFRLAAAAFDDPTQAADKQANGERMVRALIDMRDNALTDRVDSLHTPMNLRIQAVANYVNSNGATVDVAALEASRQQNRLPVRTMDAATFFIQQDIRDHDGLFVDADGYLQARNPQYMGMRVGLDGATIALDGDNAIRITAGDRTIRADLPAGFDVSRLQRSSEEVPGWQGYAHYAYRQMNSVEDAIANVRATIHPEAANIERNWQAWQAVRSSDTALRAYGANMRSNYETATELGEGLTMILHNPAVAGFANREEAQAFVLQFAGDDETARAAILNTGSTSNIFTGDRAHNMQEVRHFGEVAGALIEQTPDLLRQYGDRMGDPAITVDGRSDGRPGLAAIMRAVAADRSETDRGDSALLATWVNESGPEGLLVRQQLIDNAARAETGVRGSNVLGANRIDNLFRIAQDENLLAQGITPANRLSLNSVPEASGRAAAQAGRTGDMVALYRELGMTDEARQSGSDAVLVQSLRTSPELARDAFLGALLRNPDSVNTVITRLESLATSQREERYSDLADSISDARTAAREYQAGMQRYATLDPNSREARSVLQEATEDRADVEQELGRAYNRILQNAGNNPGNWRYNAFMWAVDVASQDQLATTTINEVINSNSNMRTAVLGTVERRLQALDDARLSSPGGRMSEAQIQASMIRGDGVYRSDVYNMPERRGILGGAFQSVGVNEDAVNQLVAGDLRNGATTNVGQPAVATPSVTVDVNTAVLAGDTRNRFATLTNALRAANLPAADDSELNGGLPLTAEQLAGALLNAGYTVPGAPVTVTNLSSDLQGTNAAATLAAAAAAYNAARATNSALPVLADPNTTTINSSEVAAAAVGSDLRAAGVAAGILGTAPVVYNPNAAENSAEVLAALTASITAANNGNATLTTADGQTITAADLAAASLAAGLVTTATTADGLLAGIDTTSLAASDSDAIAGESSAAVGTAAWWWFWMIRTKTTIPGEETGVDIPDKPSDIDGVIPGGNPFDPGPLFPEQTGEIVRNGRRIIPFGAIGRGLDTGVGFIGVIPFGWHRDEEEERQSTAGMERGASVIGAPVHVSNGAPVTPTPAPAPAPITQQQERQ